MADHMKYVIVEYAGVQTPFLFPAHIPHDSLRHFRPISAGFFCVSSGEKGMVNVSVWGDSESLKLKSRKEDAEIIAHQINHWQKDEF
jgi:hypothetical protein